MKSLKTIIFVTLLLVQTTIAAAQYTNPMPTAITNTSAQTDDRQTIEQIYRDMCQAMIDKDTATLNRIHADNYVLIHMTGMKQNKQQYLQAIADGTLNYYNAEHDKIDITVEGDKARLTGCSRVTAAVFGGGRHTWKLRLQFSLERINGQWQLTHSQASTY